MKTTLLLIILMLQIFSLYYLIRTARNLGSKATKYHVEVMENINMLRASGRDTLLTHLAVPSTKEFKNVSWDHVISLTSHPARFSTLDQSLKQLLDQHLIPKKVYLNIAEADMGKLPDSVKQLESGGILKINSCSDLGPGKKLIPTLKLEETLPIIVVDDDLVFESDLTLKLMVQHHLTPKTVVASRIHEIIFEANGDVAPYSKWVKNYSLSNGPGSHLFATSGAGTLYKKEFFHKDVMDEATYKELCFHTDDLWWHIQSKRIGVKTKRMPGFSVLNFIDGTQEVGLWQSGNQDRNDPNLKGLLKKYSINLKD
jgi:hypothetical protein